MSELTQVKARRVLPIISAITFFGFLDTHLLIPILAIYALQLGASISIIGIIIGLYSLTNTPANVLFGRLIDRVGFKVPLIAGLIGSALSMFLYSVSKSPIHLSLVRILHGTTGALIGPATMSVTAEYSGEARQGRAMSYYGMALAAATLVGYGLSGIFASRLGYRVVFLFGVVVLIIGAMLSLFLPRGKQQGGTRTSLDKGFEKAKDLISRRGLFVAYASIFAQYFTFGGVVTLLPLYVKNLGMEVFHVGMLLATFAIMFIIFQFPSGTFSDKVSRLPPAIFGLSLSIIALIMIASVEIFLLLAVALALYGAAYGILFPSISAMIAEHTVSEERGMATGIFHALLTAGVAIGAPIMGQVGATVGIKMGLALNSVVMFLALVIVIWTKMRVIYQR